ncbi:MAG: diguanylate cyclase [Deltaproteobacteria bacterium]|nr:diguanylate cyclase [Deltaproteobacteria bacterium]
MGLKSFILIAESSLEVVGVVRSQLERSGYRVEVAYTADTALSRVKATRPDAVLVGVSGMDGESLAGRLRATDPSLGIGLLSPAEDDALDWRAEAAGADACLAGSLSGANLDSCVRSVVRIGALRRRVEQLETHDPNPPPADSVEIHIEPAPIPAPRRSTRETRMLPAIQGASAGGFDFFRRLLLVEVHRSRRYKYPLAFLLSSLDGWKQRAASLSPQDQAAFMGKVLGTAVKCVRDVDLCALYGTDRFVVFMPHTAPEGAKLVAGRIHDRIRTMRGEPQEVSVSMGLSCYDGQGSISYGSLLREANEALKKAQSAGGNLIETSYRPKPRTRVSIG